MSVFQGCWKLYGNENLCALMDGLALPTQFKHAMASVRVCEEIHVNGDDVHVNIHVPTYEVPCHSKEINFQFGAESCQSLPFGKCGKVTIKKESETKWSGVVKTEHGDGSIVREILNGEMWVTLECHGVKTVRKFEKCPCPTDRCGPGGASNSPFQGEWKLYGSDNFEKFMEDLGVPAHWRCMFSSLQICEVIHVNGDNVHIRINVPHIVVPSHVHEFAAKFGEEREMKLPFGHCGKALPQKVSDTKWVAKLTGCCTLGEATLTREIIGTDMWNIIEAKGQRIIRKFERCASPCGVGSSCAPSSCK